MPLRAHHVSPRSTARRRPDRPVADVPLDAFVSLLAAGVADAQTALDARSAATAASLAETEIEVVPSVTRRIASDGAVTAETAAPERRSLLEVGITPTWYRFGETTIDVELDVGVTEAEGGDAQPSEGYAADGYAADAEASGAGADADPASEFRADTRSVADRRRFDRTAGSNARLAARLVPTPIPVRTGASEPAVDAARGGERAD